MSKVARYVPFALLLALCPALAQGLPQWEQHCSPGNSVEMRDGRLHIRARTNTYAHWSRELGEDGICVSTSIKPGSGDQGLSWCPSLMIYWDEDNWAKIGIDSRPTVHVLCVVNGAYNETLDRTVAPGAEVGVRIEVADGVVRFLYRTGEWWDEYTLRRRPGPWSAPPARLIVGKAFTLKSQDCPAPDGDNDWAAPGDWSEAEIGPVAVEPLPADRRGITPEDRRALDEMLSDKEAAAILGLPGEPSFERVAALYPAIRYGRVSAGVPEHPDEIIVYWDGRVELGSFALRPVIAGDQFGADAAHTTRSLTDGWIPVHVTRYTTGDLDCSETVFGLSKDFSPGSNLDCYLRITVRNAGETEARVPLSLALQPTSGGDARSVSLGELPVPAGEERAACIRVPYRGGYSKVVNPVVFDFALATTRQDWRNRVARGADIRVPEARVTDGYKAWLAYNWLNVDTIDGRPCPHDGCGFYEQMYGQTYAVYIEALDQYGFHKDAERYLDTLLALQRPTGELYCSYDSFFEHGMDLDALCKHYLYTRDREWLARVAPAIDSAARFIVGERAKTARLDSDPAAPLVRGLLPPSRPYCDYGSPTVSLVTDAWCCKALERASGVLADAGMVEEAGSLAADAAEYRARIEEVARGAVTESWGLKALKLEPLTGRILEQSGGMAKDYYSMYGCSILESRFFRPDDPTAAVVASFLRNGGGLAGGVTSFGGGIDHAYSSGYWLTALDRGEVDEVLLGFYTTLAYGMTQDTYSGVEVTMFRTGENQPTLPHLASGAHQLRLLRCMIAEEVGDELHLLKAIPRAWLASPEGISVSGLATFFGTVERLDVRPGDEADTVVADIELDSTAPGQAIVLRLPHPGNLRLGSAAVNGQPAAVAGEAVRFPWTDNAHVVARYAR